MGGGVEVGARVKTARTGENSIWAEREPVHNRFTIHGTVRAALDKPVEVTMHEPGLVFGRLLADRLGSLGAGGEGTSVRLAEPDEDLKAVDEMIAVVRTPLRAVLGRCNGDSHNLYAECLSKAAGHATTGQPGSWSNGAAVVRMQLRERLGPEAAVMVLIADGSGMSRSNQVTPGVLARWLAAMSLDARCGAAFVESLPRAGQEGSVMKRFEHKALTNEVRCKSGYVNGVRCLSGYVTHAASGRRITFSILVNNIPSSVPSSTVKDFHEEVVQAIDKWLSKQAKGTK
jgi:D-alanyl-D-alanine carboxypeptidase/D-alanyl-D-alanine-endopeptidase (penicillin-binding protein 4)